MIPQLRRQDLVSKDRVPVSSLSGFHLTFTMSPPDKHVTTTNSYILMPFAMIVDRSEGSEDSYITHMLTLYENTPPKMNMFALPHGNVAGRKLRGEGERVGAGDSKKLKSSAATEFRVVLIIQAATPTKKLHEACNRGHVRGEWEVEQRSRLATRSVDIATVRSQDGHTARGSVGSGPPVEPSGARF